MIIRNIINCQMSNTESFIEYTNRVMQGNNGSTTSLLALNHRNLRSKIEINMASYLAEKISHLHPADKDCITAIEIFEDWYDEVCIINREATADLKQIANFTAEHFAKHQHTDCSQFQDNTPQIPSTTPTTHQLPTYPASGANTINPNHTYNHPTHNAHNNYFPPPLNPHGSYCIGTSNTCKHLCCPKLLPTESELLDKYNGCRKCCRFFVNHCVADCPNDFPNPDTYITLTENMALNT